MNISERFVFMAFLMVAMISVISNTILWVVGAGGPEFNPDGVQKLITLATVSSVITSGRLLFLMTRFPQAWEIDERQKHG